MAIYLTLSTITAVFALVFSKTNQKIKKNNNALFNVLLFVLLSALIIIQTFRSINVGGDLHDSYFQLYNIVGRVKWSFALQLFNGYEIGYLVLNKIVYVLSGGNITALLFTISFVYILSLYHFIKKISPNRFFSFFLVLAFGIFNTSMNNLRSTVALSIVLLSLCFYLDKKWVRAFLFAALGILFHKTVVVFILFYLLALIKSKALFALICLGLVVFFTIGFDTFAIIITTIFPRYSNYFSLPNTGGGFGLMGLLFLIAFAIFFATKKSFWKNRTNVIFYKMLFFAIVLQFVSFRISFFSRAVFYFLYSIVVLVPLVFNEFKNRNLKNFAYIITILGMSAFFIYILIADSTSTVPYELINGGNLL